MSEQPKQEKRAKRATDGGTYLIVANDSTETRAALEYALQLVRRNNARLAIAHVIDTQGYSTWGGIEEMMRKELRDKAEQYVWSEAKKVNEATGIYPSIFIRAGDVYKELMDIISEPKNEIREMVLASEADGSGAGSLITHFASKVLGKLNIPLIIVPGHLYKKEETQQEE